MKKLLIVGALMLLTTSGCFLPIDKSRQGATPLKSGGYCFWYYNEKDEQYCAFDKSFPPEKDLHYQKCISCESFHKASQEVMHRMNQAEPFMRQLVDLIQL